MFSLSFFLLHSCCQGEETITVTFEGPPAQPPGSIYLITNYYEHAIAFTAPRGCLSRAQTPVPPGWPENGTSYIQPSVPDRVACTRLDGLTFRLLSVELAGYSDVVPNYPASFQGYRSDGSVINTNFVVSGLVFQTYYFSPDFTDVTNVLITAGALDNLKLQLPLIQPVLKVALSRYSKDSSVQIWAQGTPGLRYRLQRTDYYPTTNWVTVADFESATYYWESVTTNMPPQRFFRVMELP